MRLFQHHCISNVFIVLTLLLKMVWSVFCCIPFVFFWLIMLSIDCGGLSVLKHVTAEQVFGLLRLSLHVSVILGILKTILSSGKVIRGFYEGS